MFWFPCVFFHLKLPIFNKQTLPVENAIPFC